MLNINVQFNLIRDKEKNIYGYMPYKAEELSTGYDVFNAGPEITFMPFEYKLIPLGFKAFIPEGWWLFLAPRSSTHAKKKMHTLYGVIDESYENQWFFSAQYIPEANMYRCDESCNEYKSPYFSQELTIKHGDPIAQIIVMPKYLMGIEEVSDEKYKELCQVRGAKRGEGGFGSTDK